MLNRWRKKIPEDSIFRNPLVLDITFVLVLKFILLAILWQLAFKPLMQAAPPDINIQLLPSITTKESHHD